MPGALVMAVADDVARAADQAAEAILIEHQRRDIRGCVCGWSELGHSHPGHQVAMLREAGLLTDARVVGA
jgi:hypothetical protein